MEATQEASRQDGTYEVRRIDAEELSKARAEVERMEARQMLERTEEERRKKQAQADRAALEAKHGKVWSESELRAEFKLLGTMAPFVTVRRKSDGQDGSLEFAGSPRLYFAFKEG